MRSGLLRRINRSPLVVAAVYVATFAAILGAVRYYMPEPEPVTRTVPVVSCRCV